MFSDKRVLVASCITIAFSTPASTAQVVSTGLSMQPVSCIVPNVWNAGRMVAVVQPVAFDASAGYERASTSWTVKYKGTGADRLKGAARKRVMRYGVLWSLNPAELGVSEASAISALLRAGARIARTDGNGGVYFRAREENRTRIADKAASYLRKTMVTSTRGVTPGTVRMSMPGALYADVLMVRLEGRASHTAIEFIDNMPSGITVMPFGTSFVVHAPAENVAAIGRYMDEEGDKAVMLGASSQLEQGRQIGNGLRSCGGAGLMDRFPTPTVQGLGNATAAIDVEGMRLRVDSGDMVLVVQTPPYGRGLEVAVMRFAAK